jgi:hypothetical protein
MMADAKESWDTMLQQQSENIDDIIKKEVDKALKSKKE